jgi:hypothetical protein
MIDIKISAPMMIDVSTFVFMELTHGPSTALSLQSDVANMLGFEGSRTLYGRGVAPHRRHRPSLCRVQLFESPSARAEMMQAPGRELARARL